MQFNLRPVFGGKVSNIQASTESKNEYKNR